MGQAYQLICHRLTLRGKCDVSIIMILQALVNCQVRLPSAFRIRLNLTESILKLRVVTQIIRSNRRPSRLNLRDELIDSAIGCIQILLLFRGDHSMLGHNLRDNAILTYWIAAVGLVPFLRGIINVLLNGLLWIEGLIYSFSNTNSILQYQ